MPPRIARRNNNGTQASTTGPTRSMTEARLINANIGMPVPTRFSPFKELGTSGVAVFGGRPIQREKDYRVSGPWRWITYSDIMANISIVAAGVRYFLNIVANSKWSLKPPDDSQKAKDTAEMLDKVMNSMVTPWRRVARRAAMYRFLGFGVQEWTAKRLDDGTIGLDDIEARPQHTIWRWEMDERGSVQGVWQMSPQTSELIFLPRKKILYMVEDSLTDSPEGLGLMRHLVEPSERLKKYLLLEGQGFERDLRGIPIGRVPYSAIRAAVAAGTMTADEGKRLIEGVEDFVKIQATKEDTSIVLDSTPYIVETEGGKTVSGVMQYGLDLLQGQARDFQSMASAIDRLNHEMARILGVENLLLGDQSSGGNRALAEDKSRNFYLMVNGTLDEITDSMQKDVIKQICDLNGIKEELRPEVTHSDISFRSVDQITSALRDMATAGAVLGPQDPAIDDVRDLLGLPHAPEPPEGDLGLPPELVSPGQLGVTLPDVIMAKPGAITNPLEAGGTLPSKRPTPGTKTGRPNGGLAGATSGVVGPPMPKLGLTQLNKKRTRKRALTPEQLLAARNKLNGNDGERSAVGEWINKQLEAYAEEGARIAELCVERGDGFSIK